MASAFFGYAMRSTEIKYLDGFGEELETGYDIDISAQIVGEVEF
ncbi:MAG: hypothetical protein NZ879_05525 [Archaeoglobaceae archaeon]|nr:hypothetical protein [Archaeoglobaceae archaeon]MDW8118426.1 hypothetical protein [Archaeoglobaceae archaeon]